MSRDDKDAAAHQITRSGLCRFGFILAVFVSSCASLRPPQAIDRLKPCTTSEGPADAYCGKLEVWEDRAARSGRKLALKIVVLPGLRRNPAPDPLFFLAGGPGQGAAKMARQVRDIFNNVQVGRDLVLVDQRGTGDSNPLECKTEEDSFEPDPNKALERLRVCLASYAGKADVRLYTTSTAMDDLDDVRQFLGYSRINLYGGSYGTRAAITFARRHGPVVRSVVLDGVAPTELRLPLYMARDSQRALDLLVRDCESDAACRGRFPELGARLKRLFTRLNSHPEHVRIYHPRTGNEVELEIGQPTIAAILFGALYSSQTAALIPLLIERAEKNDFQGFLALSSLSGDASDNMAQGMQLSVLCSEDTTRIEPGALRRETAGTFFGYELSTWRVKACDFWPRGEVESSYYEPAAGGIPALILSGELDPVTPPSWGELVASQWKGARHIVTPGIGHGAVASGCVLKVIGEFLDKASTDGLNVECIQRVRRPPFFLGASGPIPESAAHP